MSGYEVARLDEIEELDDGRIPFRPVRHHFGITSFGITAWTAREAGDRMINEHDEDDDGSGTNEELYLVTAGRARFELDGDSVDAPAGTFVFARAAVTRTAFAEEAGTTIVAMGATSGQTYEALGWEIWSSIRPIYERGDHAGVVARLRPIVDEHPQYALLLFNLACCEAQIGDSAEAIDHLRRAVELSTQFLAYARDDSDLDPIRDEPGFKDIVGDQD
jgi:tetratricopeptide (TPR) repeat protein